LEAHPASGGNTSPRGGDHTISYHYGCDDVGP
jgi:hypothetical protein